MENGKQPILDNQFEDNKELTKREYFAGLAIQGILTTDKLDDWDVTDIAYVAVKMADALLDRLKSE